MPHLLYLLPYLEQGGTEKHALSLIAHFKQFYQVTLLAPTGTTAYQFEALQIPHWTFERWDYHFLRGVQQVRTHLQAIHRQQPIDLIHVHGAHELMVAVKVWMPQTRLIFTVHGYHGSSQGFSYWSSGVMAQWCADRVIVVCEAEKTLMTQGGLNPQKISVIHNGVAPGVPHPDRTAALAQRWHLSADQIIVGTVARLTPAKGLTYLLTAFKHLTQTYDRLQLIIAGEGELAPSLKHQAQELGLEEQVTFTGYIDHLPDLVDLFDIFVLPSLQEAFSLACLEAMALKKPIVATTVGGFREQVHHGKTGLLVPPAQPEALELALGELIRQPDRRRALGEAGYAHYLQNFTQSIMVKKVAEIYADLATIKS